MVEIERTQEKTTSGTAAELHNHDHRTQGLETVIGLALVLGFIFMLLIDQIGSSRTKGKFQVRENDRNWILFSNEYPVSTAIWCND